MVFLKKHISWLIIFLLPMYLLVEQNSIRYTHTHVLANGVVVTHTHICKNKTLNHHSHSKKELNFYASVFFHFYSGGFSFSPVIEAPMVHFFDYLVADDKVNAVGLSCFLIPRAPPVLF